MSLWRSTFLLFCIWPIGLVYAQAQLYPNRPVRIVSSEPASTNDVVARLMAQGLTDSLGQQVIVDNRGLRAIEVVAGAQPDGYTLLAYGSPIWVLPFLRKNVPWDPIKSFSPITWSTNSPNILVIHPSVPAKSIKELIALARAKPGALNYSTSSPGASAHLAGALFTSLTRLNIVPVGYKGTTSALNGVVVGETQMMFATAAAVAPHVTAGRLRALAVTSDKPTDLAPGLPTVAAAGVPGYEASLVLGVLAPAGTSPEIVERLNKEMVRYLREKTVKERLFRLGVDVMATTQAEFASKIRSEIEKWGKAIKDAGIQAN